MITLNQSAFDMIKPMPLFNPAMRAANRAGNKTQTRRILKLPKWSTCDWKDFELTDDSYVLSTTRPDGYNTPMIIASDTGCLAEISCPYGYPTDLRYMREPLFCGEDGLAYYSDYVDDPVYKQVRPIGEQPSPIGNNPVYHLVTGERIKWDTWKAQTITSLYMPKYAARTFKRYKFIRVEHLQDISKADCIAEGMIGLEDVHAGYHQSYATLWDSLNADRGYPWDSNPYVWVIGYDEDEAIAKAQQ